MARATVSEQQQYSAGKLGVFHRLLTWESCENLAFGGVRPTAPNNAENRNMLVRNRRRHPW